MQSNAFLCISRYIENKDPIPSRKKSQRFNDNLPPPPPPPPPDVIKTGDRNKESQDSSGAVSTLSAKIPDVVFSQASLSDDVSICGR